jgi:ferrochelatase
VQRADHLLLIGFGGPEKPEEVRPFLERLTQGTRIPEERLQEVESHYRLTGGSSLYNRHAQRLAEKLREQSDLPVFLGMRNWRPFLSDTLREIAGKGLRRGAAVVLAPHRSEASFGRYVKSLEESVREAAAPAEYQILPSWHNHPLFVEAQADRVRPLLNGNPGVHLLFTAHSIPLEMANASSYAAEIAVSAGAVAAAVGAERWSVAYQSRSGPPGQPWLEPDVLAEIRRLKTEGVRTVIAVPIGFLFDHTEVLYDLDVEAKQTAEREGLEFLRAPTVMDHPQFVRMFAELIKERNA